MTCGVGDVLDYIRSLSSRGELGSEEGLLYGDAGADVSGIMVAWMPTTAALRRAAAEGCSLVVSHEALTFHDYFPYASGPQPWKADRARHSLLLENGITVVRAHSTVDPTHVVPGFINAIGLSPPEKQGEVWSFHREQPVRLGQLSGKVAAGLGMERLRVTGDPDRMVRRVGTMVGGLGLDRHLVSWERHLMELEPDVIIAGETNDFAQRYAVASGLALIETCHSASENPGLAILAGDMASRFTGVKVVFHKEIVPWAVI